MKLSYSDRQTVNKQSGLAFSAWECQTGRVYSESQFAYIS